MATCNTVGKSSIQRVFVQIEDVSGVLQKPTAAGFVLPTGDVSINQTPEFTDSSELNESLDVMEQFKNALPAGEISFSSYMRVSSAGVLQGAALMEALMGSSAKSGGVTTFSQAICRPSVSVWVQKDHTVLFASGAVPTQLEIPLQLEDGQPMSWTLQFRKMGWAGRSFIKSVSGSAVTVETEDGVLAGHGYTVGAYIKNTTRDDDNSGAGYQITAVDKTAGVLTVSPAPQGWQADNQIDAWLPEADPIGSPVESRSAAVTVDGAAGKLREGTLTVGAPTTFLQEIGDEYPGESIDQKREISYDITMYMRAKDVLRIGKGYSTDVESAVVTTCTAENGGSVAVTLPRVQFTTPEIGEQDSVVTLTMSGRALGTSGEDSMTVVVSPAS